MPGAGVTRSRLTTVTLVRIQPGDHTIRTGRNDMQNPIIADIRRHPVLVAVGVCAIAGFFVLHMNSGEVVQDLLSITADVICFSGFFYYAGASRDRTTMHRSCLIVGALFVLMATVKTLSFFAPFIR